MTEMTDTLGRPLEPGLARFFARSSVLITGVTGFVGKVLLEKILRSCADVGSIYLIVRGKRGLRAEDRIADILKMQLFQRLRQERPQAFQKIVVLEGDLTLPDLGLKPKDRQLLLDTVNVVIHSAATVKFDEPIKNAVKMNLNGTRRIIELCNEMENIKVFVHVSTCYCNCDRGEIKEEIYPAPPPKSSGSLDLALRFDFQKDSDELTLLFCADYDWALFLPVRTRSA
ncbi:putative fatty acyl-CoA reductase CG5065 [Rhipicephalus microplus]|uniref:putative fatty acyl-CoA reductase CG5065 n=1 Tax=Rhipicephalus microplus TaxID=6941 RepID=UPI003F6C0234